MISTQPGSTPEASFKIVSLEAIDSCVSYNAGNDFGMINIAALKLSFFLYDLKLFLNNTFYVMYILTCFYFY